MRALGFLVALAACSPSEGGGPTFYDDIGPMLERHCAECHAPGRVGGIVFDAKSTPALAPVILANIKPRCGDNSCIPPRMPPWLPGPESVAMAHDRSLSVAEVALFERWAASPRTGQPRPLPTSSSDVAIIPPTDHLQTDPYQSRRVASDEQRCFVLRPRPGFVVAYRWQIDDLAAVHHIGADFHVGSDVTLLTGLDAADPDPGFDCSNGVVPGAAIGNLANSSIAPGIITRYPDGVGVPVPDGAVMVLSLHILPSKQKQASITGVDLWYADKPVQPVRVWGQLAPSELPCPPSISGQPQCQRAFAVSQAIVGPGIPTRAEQLQQCGSLESVGVESGRKFEITASCLSPVPPGKLRVIAVRIHAHSYTTKARLSAQRLDGSWFTLLDIPHWRWLWEENYTPTLPITIAGMTRLDCEYDNGFDNQWSALTGAPSDGPGLQPLESPQYHVLSLRRRDEMCQAIIEYVEVGQ